MRCGGTSYEDIHFRKHNRIDRKFAYLCYSSKDSDIDGSDQDAVFLHFGQSRKNNIESAVKEIYGDLYARI